jgi:exopolysaccharide production protein ExoZ
MDLYGRPLKLIAYRANTGKGRSSRVLTSDQDMVKPPGYVYGIDLIRFLAALSVVGFHFGYLNDIADFKPIWPITWFGWIGVEVFFVISGFVIANSANGKSSMRFLKGRALRLYPAVWCCATLTLIVTAAISDRPLLELLPSYLRSLALIPKGPWIDDVYWTLAVEIGFYTVIFGLLCAGVFLLLTRVAFLLTAFSSICLCILASRHWHLLEQSRLVDLLEHSNALLARHGCFFALGAWIWISTTRPLKVWECAAVAFSFLVCIVEICLRGLDFLPFQIGNSYWLMAPAIVWSAAVACVFAFSRPRDAMPISDGMARRVRTIGLMTYPLYLVHHVVGIASMKYLVSSGLDKWLTLAFGVLSSVALSWIVCKCCEPRIREVLSGIAIDRPVLQNQGARSSHTPASVCAAPDRSQRVKPSWRAKVRQLLTFGNYSRSG